MAKGTLNFPLNQVFQDSCPNRVIVTFVCSEATSGGSLTKNPWNFQNYNLSQISVSVDDAPVNGEPMQISYDSTNGYTITRVLTNLLESTKKWLNDEEKGLDRDDIAGGCALYACDTQPDFDGNEYLSLKKSMRTSELMLISIRLYHTPSAVSSWPRNKDILKFLRAATSS